MEAPPVATLYTKMARVMAGLENIPANGFNKFHKYKFVTNADASNAIREGLAREGIAFITEMVEVVPSPANDKAYRVKFNFTLACGETGATITAPWIVEVIHTNRQENFDDKALVKATTLAKKYFLLGTFLASYGGDEDDPDQDTQTQTQAPPRQAQSRGFDPYEASLESVRQGTGKISNAVIFTDSTGRNITVFPDSKAKTLLGEQGYKVEAYFKHAKPDIETPIQDQPVVTVRANAKGFPEIVRVRGKPAEGKAVA